MKPPQQLHWLAQSAVFARWMCTLLAASGEWTAEDN